MKRSLKCLITILLLVFFSLTLAGAAEFRGLYVAWSSLRGSNCNMACGKAHHIKGTVKWKTLIREGIASEVILTGQGTGFIAVRTQLDETRVYAFDCTDGQIIWGIPISHRESILGVPAPAVDAAGNLYITTLDGRLLALSTTDGGQVWSFDSAADAPTPNVTSAKTDGNLVYVGVQGALYALEKQTGKLKWQRQLGQTFVMSPAVCPDGRLYAVSDRALVAMESSSGRVLWESASDGLSVPLVDARMERVYLVSRDTKCRCFDRLSGRELWSTNQLFLSTNMAARMNGPIFAGRTIIGQEGVLYALDRTSGRIVWTYAPVSGMMISPCVGEDGTVYTAVLPKLVAIDGVTHKKKWALDLKLGPSASSPSIGSDGAIYIANGNGALYAVQ